MSEQIHPVCDRCMFIVERDGMISREDMCKRCVAKLDANGDTDWKDAGLLFCDGLAIFVRRFERKQQ